MTNYTDEDKNHNEGGIIFSIFMMFVSIIFFAAGAWQVGVGVLFFFGFLPLIYYVRRLQKWENNFSASD